MDSETLIENSRPFLQYVLNWEAALPELDLASAVPDPRAAAVISVDVINGFCH